MCFKEKKKRKKKKKWLKKNEGSVKIENKHDFNAKEDEDRQMGDVMCMYKLVGREGRQGKRRRRLPLPIRRPCPAFVVSELVLAERVSDTEYSRNGSKRHVWK